MSDSIRRVDVLRKLYKAQAGPSSNELDRSLKELTTEIRVANDTAARAEQITAATGSPYLSDQSYYSKEVFYNSPKETEWREVKTFEETRKDALVFKNLRKLNII